MEKIKKINNKGFVLAETLIVTVIILTLFTMIYINFYPLIGEYEKREVYDDADGKYAIYWIKRIIESDSYTVNDSIKHDAWNKYGYIRFECKDVNNSDNMQSLCKELVKSLEFSNCDNEGNNCDIFITKYQIGSGGAEPSGSNVFFKDTVNNDNPIRSGNNKSIRKYEELGKSDCSGDASLCDKVFPSYFVDYINYLPDYSNAANNTLGYECRVLAIIHHQKSLGKFDYYSFANMQVDKKYSEE